MRHLLAPLLMLALVGCHADRTTATPEPPASGWAPSARPAPAPAPDPAPTPARDSRPRCSPAQLRAELPEPGGGAGGTYYSLIELTNQGPACVLTTGGLTLWAGGRRVATLDLADHGGLMSLPGGRRLALRAYVPDQRCFIAGRDRVRLALAAAHTDHAQLPVVGPALPSAYARCAGVGLIAGARRAAPSR